jgi:anhydro-N-acetylmuramic acid kinase
MIDALHEILSKPARRIVGLMSGTSMDGIDAALVLVHGAGTKTRVELETFACTPYSDALRQRLVRVAAGEPLPSAEHARLEFDVAASFAQAALEVVERSGHVVGDVDLIGSHGQTLFHHGGGAGVRGERDATWQAGSLPAIAALTGLVTVGDFRSADIALGGTGAPLVPYVDYLLRRSPTESRILLNVGGIANLTYLRAGCGPDSVVAWDVGPGNLVIDGLAQRLLGRDRDEDGGHAARGRADVDWVESLLEGDYFLRPAPKSAGREEFGAVYVEQLLAEARRRGVATDDLLATAVELTARGVATACARPPLAGQPVDAVYVTGGGRHNATLLGRLATLLHPVVVRGFESLGLDPDAKEAVDFAVLANETVHGHAGNLRQVTGASRACILGAIAVGGLSPRPGGAS